MLFFEKSITYQEKTAKPPAVELLVVMFARYMEAVKFTILFRSHFISYVTLTTELTQTPPIFCKLVDPIHSST